MNNDIVEEKMNEIGEEKDNISENKDMEEESNLYAETTDLLLKEFEKNEKILDSIFIEFQSPTNNNTIEDSEETLDIEDDIPEKEPWLETISNEDMIEIEILTYDLIGEYIYNEIGNMSCPSFNENMVSAISEMLQNQLIELQLSKDDYYEEIEEYVEEVCNQFYDTHLDIPPRSYPNTFTEIDSIDHLIKKYSDQLSYLKTVDTHKQKTKEWYQYRYNIITASNLWKIFGSESQQNNLICEKCKPLDTQYQVNSFINVNSPLHWGNKYEPLTIIIYEDLYNTKVDDFGCIPHKKYPFIGASPDGINIDPTSFRYGRMVEVKNIFNREITGIPKEEYWIQMQMQMETCDLDECDFIETRFKEYETEDDFYLNKDVYEYSGVVLYFINKITQFENVQYTPKYVYMPLNIEKEKSVIDKWIKDTQLEMKSQFTLYEIKYWYLDEISCVLVKRNREWFKRNIEKIEDFWKIIEKERVTGYEHRLAKKKPAKPEVMHESNDTSQYIKNLACSKSICLIKVDENGDLMN